MATFGIFSAIISREDLVSIPELFTYTEESQFFWELKIPNSFWNLKLRTISSDSPFKNLWKIPNVACNKSDRNWNGKLRTLIIEGL